MKILIVDDSATFAMYLSLVLNRMGYEVTSVLDGVEALKLAPVLRPDLILLDVAMPNMDGVTTLRLFREQASLSRVPVLMVSADASDSTRALCERYHCSGFLPKPVDIHILHRALQHCLGKRWKDKRRFPRAHALVRVTVAHGGSTADYDAVSLSVGGVFIRTERSLPVHETVRVTVHAAGLSQAPLNGTVIYASPVFTGLQARPGMAIAFTDLSEKDRRGLQAAVANLIAGDIIARQEEPCITPALDDEDQDAGWLKI